VELQLIRIVERLPAGIGDLEREATAEGHRNMARLVADWHSGTVRFDRPGEALIAAQVYGILIGIGGVTHDPDVHGALRMRRFFVRERLRGHGIGRAIVTTLLNRVPEGCGHVTVHAERAESAMFWRSFGFTAFDGENHTHELRLRPRHVEPQRIPSRMAS
jgi:GNAT superfamily N-acetyltransferase